MQTSNKMRDACYIFVYMSLLAVLACCDCCAWCALLAVLCLLCFDCYASACCAMLCWLACWRACLLCSIRICQEAVCIRTQPYAAICIRYESVGHDVMFWENKSRAEQCGNATFEPHAVANYRSESNPNQIASTHTSFCKTC